MRWARASMKGRTEHKESIWLWAIILHSPLKEWLLLVPAAFCNPEDNPRLGWEGGELHCTSFCPFVETDWAKTREVFVTGATWRQKVQKLSLVGLAVIHFAAGGLQFLSWWELLHAWLTRIHVYIDSCAMQQQTHLSYADCLTSAQSITILHGFISLALNFIDKNGKMNENLHLFSLCFWSF